MATKLRIRRRPADVLVFAALFGLAGGLVLGVALALPDAFTEAWRSLWLVTGLVGALMGLGVALVTAAVWVVVERRTPRRGGFRLVVLPPVTAFVVVLLAWVLIGRDLSVLAAWPVWGLAGMAALLAAAVMPWVGWQRPREDGKAPLA